MTALLAALRRDLLLAARRRSEVVTALFFFIVVVSLFPLGIGPEPELLRRSSSPYRSIGMSRRRSLHLGLSLGLGPTGGFLHSL